MQQVISCAEESRLADETLAGSFKPADTFFLIESSLPAYGGWGNGIVKTAGKSGDFAPYLQHLQRAPQAKILFIRQPQSQGKNFYIVTANQPQPKIYHSALSAYDQLLELDIESLAGQGAPQINGTAMSEIEELYIVCANGRHDPCCATYGVPVYHQLAAQVPADRVWQTTHIGGHRMAATMIAFPQAIVYGHLDPPHAEEILSNHRAGYILTHKFRGRAAYAGHQLEEGEHLAAGAAEAAIRERARNYRDDSLRLISLTALEADKWQVTFQDDAGISHTAEVKSTLSAPRRTSCGDPPKPLPQHQVELSAAL